MAKTQEDLRAEVIREFCGEGAPRPESASCLAAQALLASGTFSESEMDFLRSIVGLLRYGDVEALTDKQRVVFDRLTKKGHP